MLMKKFILLYLFTLCTVLCAYSQSAVYVIFTPIESDTKGVEHSVFNIHNLDGGVVHIFTIFELAKNTRKKLYFYRFEYDNRKDNVDNPFQVKSKDFLNSVNLVDWDLVEGKTNVESKFKYIMSHDKIYFIDRNESTNDSVKIYPVTRWVPKY